MSGVIEHLAQLTGFRDRDVLDVTLVGALRDLLEPGLVAIHRAVGEGGERRWLTRARLAAGQRVAAADALATELDELPALHADPGLAQCLLREAPLELPGPPLRHLFPLASEREVFGVLEVARALPLGADERRTVDGILRIYRNMHWLLDDSERDTLTGLLNRKTFDEAFLRLALEAPAEAPAGPDGRRAAGAAHWLGVIDIDHFKAVNDRFGHLIGDEVLLLLSRLMRGSFRFQDRLYRFGGEEFVVLLRGRDAAGARGAFERLRAAVQAYAFPRVGHITVSIGFTQVRPGESPSAAFERADQAVYHAKGHGRNQVADHAALAAAGTLADAAPANDVELF